MAINPQLSSMFSNAAARGFGGGFQSRGTNPSPTLTPGSSRYANSAHSFNPTRGFARGLGGGIGNKFDPGFARPAPARTNMPVSFPRPAGTPSAANMGSGMSSMASMFVRRLQSMPRAQAAQALKYVQGVAARQSHPQRHPLPFTPTDRQAAIRNLTRAKLQQHKLLGGK